MVVQNMSRRIDFTLHTAGMRKMAGQCDIRKQGFTTVIFLAILELSHWTFNWRAL